jgi:hypothetical protein
MSNCLKPGEFCSFTKLVMLTFDILLLSQTHNYKLGLIKAIEHRGLQMEVNAS